MTMRTVVGIAVIAMFLGICRGNAKMTDRDISTQAGAQASVLLNQDIDSTEGRRFLDLARLLEPQGSVVQALDGDLERGTAPQVQQPAVNKEELIQEIKVRALTLLKTRFKSSASVGKLSLLYLLFADALTPNDLQILNGLAYLQSYGIQGELSVLLEDEWDLEAIQADKSKPVKIAGPRLNDTDAKIAKETIRVAADLLAEDPKNAAGLAALRFARYLLPGETKGILLSQQIQRAMKIEPMKSRFSADQFSPHLVKRGIYYLKQPGEEEYNTHLAGLYIRVAESFNAEDPKTLIALEKLAKLDYGLGLDELCQVDMGSLIEEQEGWSDTKDAPTPQYPTYGKPEEPTEPITKFGKAELSKFHSDAKAKVNSSKGKGDGGGQARNDHVVVTMTFDNKLKRPVEGLQTTTYLIGERYKRSGTPNEIVATKSSSSITVPPGKSKDPVVVLEDDVKATSSKSFNGGGGSWITIAGHTYESYFVIVKDQSGQVIQLKGKDSRATKFAMEYALSEEGARLGLTAEMDFDRNGNRIFEE